MTDVSLAEKIACIEGMLQGRQCTILEAVLADLRALKADTLLDQICEQERRAGAEKMRERAAKECDEEKYDPQHVPHVKYGASLCAKRIRALPVE